MPDDCDKTLHLYLHTPRGVCLVSFFDLGHQIVVEGGGTGQTRSRATYQPSERAEVDRAIETLLAEGYAPIAADQVSGIRNPDGAAAGRPGDRVVTSYQTRHRDVGSGEVDWHLIDLF